MRSRGRVSLVVGLLVLVLGGSVPPALAASSHPSAEVVVVPEHPASGAAVRIRGSGFPARTLGAVKVDGRTAKLVRSTSGGRVTATVRLPKGQTAPVEVIVHVGSIRRLVTVV